MNLSIIMTRIMIPIVVLTIKYLFYVVFYNIKYKIY